MLFDFHHTNRIVSLSITLCLSRSNNTTFKWSDTIKQRGYTVHHITLQDGQYNAVSFTVIFYDVMYTDHIYIVLQKCFKFMIRRYSVYSKQTRLKYRTFFRPNNLEKAPPVCLREEPFSISQLLPNLKRLGILTFFVQSVVYSQYLLLISIQCCKDFHSQISCEALYDGNTSFLMNIKRY